MAFPQFQIIEHQKTGVLRGRIYFPGQWLAYNEHRHKLYDWMQRQDIQFGERDLKCYQDGSIRLYFTASHSEYERLANKYRHRANFLFMKTSTLADRSRSGELALQQLNR
jgi:hypothetical protein